MHAIVRTVCAASAVLACKGTPAELPHTLAFHSSSPVEFCAEELNRSEPAPLQPDASPAEDVPPPVVTFLDNAAIVVEYPSVYDVHTTFDQSRPKRSQPGSFRVTSILEDLSPYLDESIYDFVLMYSLEEVPGWIHAGGQWHGAPAKNIGQANSTFGNGRSAGTWVRLRGTPHMNSIDLFEQWELFPGSDAATLVPLHEIGHYWMVNWSRSSDGPREWRPGDPVAYLAGATYHWSWNWIDTIAGPENMPGIMYSAPLSYQFNEFDLYAMGLMEFSELSGVSHAIYECAPPDYNACNPGNIHELRIEHLVESLALEGPFFFEGDGRRIPPSDLSAQDINTLIVVIKGENETLTDRQASLIRAIGTNLPATWSTATLGRSEMSTTVRVGATGFSIGGTVEGLSGTGLVVRNNNGDDLAIDSNGGFTFTTALENGIDYEVTVFRQPDGPGQFCTVANGSGTVDNRDVTDIMVNCSPGADSIINPGLNDAWFDPQTPGQGFFFTVFPELELFFLSWFTYEVERPDESIQAILGEPGHRWLTALGTWEGNTATLTVELTRGGVFDSPEPPVDPSVEFGTITLVFHDCTRATLTYEIPSPGLFGVIELTRLAIDNVALCEALRTLE